MVQDNNLPTQERFAVESDQQDERFIHPDDVRGQDADAMNTDLNSYDCTRTGPIVLVTTDAALRMVPSVCHILSAALSQDSIPEYKFNLAYHSTAATNLHAMACRYCTLCPVACDLHLAGHCQYLILQLVDNLMLPTDELCLLQHVLPLGARVVINYDLPVTKEDHNRRLTKTLGSTSPECPTGAAIHFVVAGQMAAFRSLEKLANAPIYEMPVHAADILS